MLDFSIGSDSDSDPLIEMYGIGTYLSLGRRSVPKMGTVTIWERDPNPNPSTSLCSGNMSCISLCSHRVWNLSLSPNLNPSPSVEISLYA